MTTPTTPERAMEIAAEHGSDTPTHAALISLAKQVEALTADLSAEKLFSSQAMESVTEIAKQRDALHAIIVESVAALGTAASVSQTSSIEFLQYVPGAIRNTVDALKADAVRVDWLEQQRQCYGFDGVHKGNRWVVDGQYRTARIGIDAAMKVAS